MAQPVHIVGSYLSPYVRKVLVALEWKGISYEIDPIVPYTGGEAFTALSPLRRVPVLVDEAVTLCDSSVICQYLEDRHPEPALYPADVADRARARWLEEYADTRMGDVFVWGLFDQKVIGPGVWRRPPDEAVVARLLAEEVPEVLGYLESQLPEQGFAFGALSVADVSVASFFRNAGWAGLAVDARRWPRTAAFVARVLALAPFARLRSFEELSLRTPLPRQREALRAAGAPVAAHSVGGEAPRPGARRP